MRGRRLAGRSDKRGWMLVTPSAHLIQLDSLRAFAVILVVLSHTSSAASRLTPCGPYGVRLFFVLSGFLITGILLRGRDAGLGAARLLPRFYARRVLRIFPLFYAATLAAATLSVPGVRRQLIWCLLYVANFDFILHGWQEGKTAHYWSLAVEEQFYVVAPLVILLTPRRCLWRAVVAGIIGAPVYRICAALGGLNFIAIGVAPVSCLDSLGIGALLALAFDGRYGVGRAWIRWVTRAGLVLVVIDLAAYYSVSNHHVTSIGIYNGELVIRDLAAALVSAGLVAGAANGFIGLPGTILSFLPIVYLGTISYGIYVYHPFVSYYLQKVWAPEGETAELGFFVIVTVVTSTVAALSWHLFERPINNLKRFVRYDACSHQSVFARG